MASLSQAPSSKTLPPGAAQLLPLVESFFISCALQGSVLPSAAPLTTQATGSSALRVSNAGPTPSSSGLPPPSPSHSAMSTGSRDKAGTGGGGAAALFRAGSTALDEKQGAFVRFVERHSRLLNAYVRRTPHLLEGESQQHDLISFALALVGMC